MIVKNIFPNMLVFLYFSLEGLAISLEAVKVHEAVVPFFQANLFPDEFGCRRLALRPRRLKSRAEASQPRSRIKLSGFTQRLHSSSFL